MIAQAAHVPVLEPADSQECYDYFKYAPQLSETLDMPVIVRLTTRISHARGFVALGDQVGNFEKDYEKQPAKYIMMPGYARGRKVDLLKRIEAAKKLSDSTELNRIEAGRWKGRRDLFWRMLPVCEGGPAACQHFEAGHGVSAAGAKDPRICRFG